jgi:cysteine desulfurase family protein
MKTVYFDNAATSFPKAPNVSSAICNYIDNIGANVGRGTYESAYNAGSVVFETRELICDLFNYNNPMNIAFTMNITQSMNIILKGLLKPGDHVIVSSMEHNAIMRPLNTLKGLGVEIDKVVCNPDGSLDTINLRNLIKGNTKLVIMTHASNVCGTILPIEEIGKLCKEKGLFFLLDTAQSAGTLEVDFNKLNLSALAFTGHKGMLGPQGIGGFILDNALIPLVSSYFEGGTGSNSESEVQPIYMPDKFESGTLNIPGIYGLNASLKYLKSIGLDNIYKTEMELSSHFINKLLEIPSVDIIGLKGINNRTSVVSLNFKNLDNSDVAFHLDKDYKIMTRVGLHCAPSAHKTLGTYPQGTVRFSFGHFNTLSEIDYAIDSILKIVKKV